MTNSFREQLKDKNIKIILSLSMVAAFVVPVIINLVRSPKADQTVATVNGNSIYGPEFAQAYYANKNIKDQIQQQFGPSAEFLLSYYGLSGNLEQVTLNQLIQEKLLESVVNKYGFVISEEYIQDKMNDPVFVKSTLASVIPHSVLLADGSIDVNKLNKYLLERGISTEQFDIMVKKSFEKELLNQLISPMITVPDSMVKELYIKSEVPRGYNIISLDLERYKNQVKTQELSDQELMGFYNQHMQEYATPEKRSATVWKFTPEDFGIKVSDKEIQDYYDNNKKSFEKEFKDVQDEIKKIILQDKFIKRFASQASRAIGNSKDKDNSVLNFVNQKKGVVSKLDNISASDSLESQKIFSIKQVGNYVTYNNDGIGYIAKLDNIEKSTIPAYKDIENQVKEDLIDYKAAELLKENIENSYNSMISGNKALADLAKEYNVEIKNIKINPKDKENKQEDLPVQDMLNLTYKGSLDYVINNNNGYIIELENIENIDQEAFDKNKQEYKRQAHSLLESVTYQSFIENLRKNAIIKYNR